MNYSSLNGRLVIKPEEALEDDDYPSPLKRFRGGEKMSHLPPIIRGSRAVKQPRPKSIKLGETFQSFEEVSRAITMYEIGNNVHLTQKYFRRIAANPKPSNKEDFMLSEEERKRFVYRWVDFCCTYFDDMMTRTDPDDEDGNSSNQALGFAMKECPMRIRFQLRFNEKDLMISIFKEEHDHNRPTSELPLQVPAYLPKHITEVEVIGGTPVARLSDYMNVKRTRPPPPSLAPLSSIKLAKQAPLDSQSQSDSRSPVVTRCQNPLLIRKPPPLKAMPLLSSSTDSPTPASGNGHIQGLSTENVIRNIYNYLCRLQSTGPSSALRFTSPNPDLVKITSELSGVDTERISSLCQRNKPHKLHPARTNEQLEVTSRVNGSSASGSSALAINTVSRRKQNLRSALNSSDITVPVPSLNTQSQFSNPLFEETDANYLNMPLEVIIKSDPDEHIDYFDENDSNSSMSMTMNDDFFGSERNHAPR